MSSKKIAVAGGIGLGVLALGAIAYFALKKKAVGEAGGVPVSDTGFPELPPMPVNLGFDISKYKQAGEPERVLSFIDLGTGELSPFYWKELPWSKKMFLTITNPDGSLFWNSKPYSMDMVGLILMSTEARNAMPVWKGLVKDPWSPIQGIDSVAIKRLQERGLSIYNGMMDHIYEGSSNLDKDSTGDYFLKIATKTSPWFRVRMKHPATLSFRRYDGVEYWKWDMKANQYVEFKDGQISKIDEHGNVVQGYGKNASAFPIFVKQTSPVNTVASWGQELDKWRAVLSPPKSESDAKSYDPNQTTTKPSSSVVTSSTSISPSTPISPSASITITPTGTISKPTGMVSERAMTLYGCFSKFKKNVSSDTSPPEWTPPVSLDGKKTYPSVIITMIKPGTQEWAFFDLGGNELDYRLGRERPDNIIPGGTWTSPLIMDPNLVDKKKGLAQDTWWLKRYTLMDNYNADYNNFPYKIVKTDIGVSLWGWVSNMYDKSQMSLLAQEVKRMEGVWNTRCGPANCVQIDGDAMAWFNDAFRYKGVLPL